MHRIRNKLKNALIFGLTGQDGAYLSDFLVKKGYNAYLKANKQDKGIASYSYVVDLFITYFESLKDS